MTSLLRALRGRGDEARDSALSFSDFLSYFSYGGLQYPLMMQGGTPGQDGEKIGSSFEGYVRGAYKANGVIFACMAARALLFSEARFQFRQMRFGRPGDLFGTRDLAPLEVPWTNGTTGDLLTRAITDADVAGNFYATRRGNAIRRLRPDWVTIVTGSATGSEIDTEVIGYAYEPGGPGSGRDVEVILPEHMAHWAPFPDPVARVRGMSWLTPIIDEITADISATTHKRMFFQNGAKLSYVVTLGDADINPEKFERWIAKFKAGHENNALNLYKTLFLAGGADVKVVGADMKQIDFSSVQGHGETRICAAARVPPIIVGLSEGLDAATYSNYGQARRAFADLTMRPSWRGICGALAPLVQIPGGAELWYDDRDISFLQEDMKDEAAIQQTQAVTIRELINAGYEPDTVVKAVLASDYSLLKHTGLMSVQLQPPGTTAVPPAANGTQPAGLPTGA